jgi:hypothetical protein
VLTEQHPWSDGMRTLAHLRRWCTASWMSSVNTALYARADVSARPPQPR